MLDFSLQSVRCIIINISTNTSINNITNINNCKIVAGSGAASGAAQGQSSISTSIRTSNNIRTNISITWIIAFSPIAVPDFGF